MNKRLIFLLVLMSFSNLVLAADPDFYRSTGKIYGAYGAALILILGLLVYLFSIDKKLSKIERQLEDE